jgi:hypothetical protein
LSLTSDLISGVECGDVALVYVLDMSAAFDTVDHDILLERLAVEFGFGFGVLDWMTYYLTGRHQSLCVGGRKE